MYIKTEERKPKVVDIEKLFQVNAFCGKKLLLLSILLQQISAIEI